MKKFFKIIKIISINLIILILLLAFIDSFFPTINSRGSARRFVPIREYLPYTDAYLSPPFKPYRLRTDNNGFIIGENNNIENDSVDIIFFGGSTTACIAAQMNSRFPYLVGEKIIDTRTGYKLKTLNGGFPGSHSLHSTINLLAKGVPLHPKKVILMHNVNDLGSLRWTGNYWEAPATREIIRTKSEKLEENPLRARLRALKNLLFPKLYSEFIRSFIKFRSRVFSQFFPQEARDEWKGFRDKGIQDYSVVEKSFEQSFLNFINSARSFDIEPILMTQFNRIDDAYRGKVHSIERRTKYKKLNDKVREIAKKENLFLIDLDKQVPKSDSLIYDRTHLNTRGSKLVADIIAKELADHYAYFTLKN